MVAVGAPEYNSIGKQSGAVFIFALQPSRNMDVEQWQVLSDRSLQFGLLHGGDLFGWSIAYIGNQFDGSLSTIQLAVGSPGRSSEQPGAGCIYTITLTVASSSREDAEILSNQQHVMDDAGWRRDNSSPGKDLVVLSSAPLGAGKGLRPGVLQDHGFFGADIEVIGDAFGNGLVLIVVGAPAATARSYGYGRMYTMQFSFLAGYSVSHLLGAIPLHVGGEGDPDAVPPELPSYSADILFGSSILYTGFPGAGAGFKSGFSVAVGIPGSSNGGIAKSGSIYNLVYAGNFGTLRQADIFGAGTSGGFPLSLLRSGEYLPQTQALLPIRREIPGLGRWTPFAPSPMLRLVGSRLVQETDGVVGVGGVRIMAFNDDGVVPPEASAQLALLQPNLDLCSNVSGWPLLEGSLEEELAVLGCSAMLSGSRHPLVSRILPSSMLPDSTSQASLPPRLPFVDTDSFIIAPSLGHKPRNSLLSILLRTNETKSHGRLRFWSGWEPSAVLDAVGSARVYVGGSVCPVFRMHPGLAVIECKLAPNWVRSGLYRVHVHLVGVDRAETAFEPPLSWNHPVESVGECQHGNSHGCIAVRGAQVGTALDYHLSMHLQEESPILYSFSAMRVHLDYANPSRSDFLIGLPHFSQTGAQKGAIQVYSEKVSTASHIQYAGSPVGESLAGGLPRGTLSYGARFGWALCSVGNVDFNLNTTVVAVSAPFQDGGGSIFLVDFVRLESGTTVNTAAEFTAPAALGVGTTEFGRSLANVGDIDADGIDCELLVGFVNSEGAGTIAVLFFKPAAQLSAVSIAQALVVEHPSVLGLGTGPGRDFGLGVGYLGRPGLMSKGLPEIVVGDPLGSSGGGGDDQGCILLAAIVADYTSNTFKMVNATVLSQGSGLPKSMFEDKLAVGARSRFGRAFARLPLDAWLPPGCISLAVGSPGWRPPGHSIEYGAIHSLQLCGFRTASESMLMPGSRNATLVSLGRGSRFGLDFFNSTTTRVRGSPPEHLGHSIAVQPPRTTLGDRSMLQLLVGSPASGSGRGSHTMVFLSVPSQQNFLWPASPVRLSAWNSVCRGYDIAAIDWFAQTVSPQMLAMYGCSFAAVPQFGLRVLPGGLSVAAFGFSNAAQSVVLLSTNDGDRQSESELHVFVNSTMAGGDADGHVASATMGWQASEPERFIRIADIRVGGTDCPIVRVDASIGLIACKPMPMLPGVYEVDVDLLSGALGVQHNARVAMYDTTKSRLERRQQCAGGTLADRRGLHCVAVWSSDVVRAASGKVWQRPRQAATHEATIRSESLELFGSRELVGLTRGPHVSLLPPGVHFLIGPYHCEGATIQAVQLSTASHHIDWSNQTSPAVMVVCPQIPNGAGGPHNIVLDLGPVGRLLAGTTQENNTLDAEYLFAAPAINRIVPDDFELTTAKNITLSIFGQGFGPDQQGVAGVSIGGLRCAHVVHVSNERIDCEGMQQHGFLNREVEVRLLSTSRRSSQQWVSHSRELLQYPDAPVAVSAVPDVVPTTGGLVSIFGLNVGLQGQYSNVTQVSFGERYSSNASSIQSTSSFELKVVVPPGTGEGFEVGLMTAGGVQTISPSKLVSFAPPKVHIVTTSPSPAISLPGVAFNVTVRGSGFGAGDQSIVVERRLIVGGATCTNLTVYNDSCMHCAELRVPTAGWETEQVHVRIDGQHGMGSFQFQPPPSVLAVQPSVALPGEIVTIRGTGFGGPGDAVQVTLGKYRCNGAQVEQDGQLLRCLVPYGAGRSLNVSVETTRNGLGILIGGFSFPSPVIAALVPNYAMKTDSLSTFNISGQFFGNGQSDLGQVSVGGVPCSQVLWLSPQLIHCAQLLADMSFQSTDVSLEVGGQMGYSSSIFESVGAPAIDSVTPARAAPGDTLVLLGRRFGYSRGDIVGVSLAGVSVMASLEYSSQSVVSILAPPVPSHLDDRRRSGDRAALLNLPLVITTRGGQTSNTALFSYDVLGAPPSQIPLIGSAWRVEGQPRRVEMLWLFAVNSSAEQSGAEAQVTSFEVGVLDAHRASRDSGFGDGSSHDADEGDSIEVTSLEAGKPQVSLVRADALETLPANPDTLLQLGLPDGLKATLYRHSQFVSSEAPLMAQVRAVSAAGEGPWSAWTLPIVATCSHGQYLSSYGSIQTWSCRECPDDIAMQCMGGLAQQVAARPGFARLPLNDAAIRMAACSNPDACIGDDLRGDVISNSTYLGGLVSSTVRQIDSAWIRGNSSAVLSHGSTLVGLDKSGWPWETEACAEGYTGTLCSTCAAGYQETGTDRCSQCSAPGVIAFAGLLLAIAVAAAVAGLTVSALRTPIRRMESQSRPVNYPSDAAHGTISRRSTSSGKARGDEAEVAPTPSASQGGWTVWFKGTGATAVLKVMFSHLQTVSTAGSLNLRWTTEVAQFLFAMDSASSVQPQALGLGCMLEPSSSTSPAAFDTHDYNATTVDSIDEVWSNSREEGVVTAGSMLRKHTLRHTQPARSDNPLVQAMPSQSSYMAQTVLVLLAPAFVACGIVVVWSAIHWWHSRVNDDSSCCAGLMSVCSWAGIKSGSANVNAGNRRSIQSGTGPSISIELGAVHNPLVVASGRAAPPRAAKGPAAQIAANSISFQSPERGNGERLSEFSSSGNTSGSDGARSSEDDNQGPPQTSLTHWLIPNAALLSYWERVLVSVIVAMNLLHMQMTRAGLSLVACTSLPAGAELPGSGDNAQQAAHVNICPYGQPDRRLSQDLNVCCSDPLYHRVSLGIGAPAIVLYACGIPLLSGLLLGMSASTMEQPKTQAQLGFLMSGYTRSAFYWEVVVLLRKATIASIAVLLEPAGERSQAYAMLCVLVALIVAQQVVQPFLAPCLNSLELVGLVAAFITYQGGLVLVEADSEDSALSVFVSTIIVLANVVFLAFGLSLLIAPMLSAYWRKLADTGDSIRVEELTREQRQWVNRAVRATRTASAQQSSIVQPISQRNLVQHHPEEAARTKRRAGILLPTLKRTASGGAASAAGGGSSKASDAKDTGVIVVDRTSSTVDTIGGLHPGRRQVTEQWGVRV